MSMTKEIDEYTELKTYKHNKQVRAAMRVLKAEYTARKKAKLTSCAQRVGDEKK